MRVLNDNVLVSVSGEGNRTTASGLFIPETAQDGQIVKGTVVTVGEGKLLQDGTRVAPSVSVGEIVWFPKFNASKIELQSGVHYVVSEQYILGAE